MPSSCSLSCYFFINCLFLLLISWRVSSLSSDFLNNLFGETPLGTFMMLSKEKFCAL